ncbi:MULTISPECIES: DUF6082 family protein [unclassified Streptomyces]|uniref:DUF6082 family protein n=1 Tax=unclassified Streptomyces TaxID=2593676 RepID=UPI00082391D8|nr:MULTISPECIES: DUF6082 family protein [unclassified Streptomyces]MYU02162.1 peptide transporter permease SapC [Streptomyces sp. SID8350]SCK61714.1 hypothetical protein YUWDRAFT_06210 [Streptomyces sp. AmelKG-D3]
MRTSTAVLTAGVAVAAVGVAQLVQKDRQHKQTINAALSGIQIDWLSRASSDPLEAKFWAPEGIEPEQYQRMLSGNRMLCQLSLRWRVGLVTRRQLALYADDLMTHATCRDYWERFGSYRESEALGNKRDETFNRAIRNAYDRAMSLAE